jgi:hypothetical protein
MGLSMCIEHKFYHKGFEMETLIWLIVILVLMFIGRKVLKQASTVLERGLSIIDTSAKVADVGVKLGGINLLNEISDNLEDDLNKANQILDKV